MGIAPEEFERCLPGAEVDMLAISGSSPMAVLENLACDEEFVGTVICSIFGSRFLPMRWESQRPHVAYYEEEWSASLRFSVDVDVLLEERLNLLHERFSYQVLWSELFGISRYLQYGLLRADRFMESRPDKYFLERAKEQGRIVAEREAVPQPVGRTPEDMEDSYAKVEDSVSKLIRRGCHVVFVRMPTSGWTWKRDQQSYPKNKYWDRFAQQTSAETFHFKDYTSLSGFECPDGSHLDYSDAVRFTRAFAELLLQNHSIVGSQ
ncbi:MAG: hypothetical protein ABGX16_24770 [Pirellulales bacterium]